MTDPAFPAEPFTHGERITLAASPLAVVRHEAVRVSDLQALFDTNYGAIALLFGTGELVPAGPAVAVYDGDPADVFDLEIGFPVVEAPIDAIDVAGVSVVGSHLPPGPAVASTLFGPYSDLPSAWAALARSGPAPAGVWIESYVSDPSEAPEQLRTDLIMPVRV
ncbi:GyrI-like domain-containing protein [Microbacterium memoriense]|uniref:GyrI-like domain-containing protein n=1 Tax=Microbacterium memoriense TaxID=2978350 RepID=A0ABT2PBQ9_9MICO|nr:GyrI-like domain-containing protein [Microbacterium memoriense]MCT9001627.1 GyrI-like domain-containing protein [Microbacterium memoriense]